MISERSVKAFCYESPFLIENYDKAISDALKGRSMSEETKQKIRDKIKNKRRVYDNKELNIYHYE